MNIQLDFEGFNDTFDKENNYFTELLKKRFNICINEKSPDYIIYSHFGKITKPIKQQNAVKIFFTDENIHVDFNLFDYGIGYDYINFNDRYIRWPLYRLWGDEWRRSKKCGSLFENLLNTSKRPEIITKEKTGFCSFVFSNSKANPIRELFFRRLSQYKKVDSGGRFLNNIGGPVKSKLDFIGNYKFNICFENASTTGYTTEKIVEAMSANTIPIYWGNPEISREFNEKSFIKLENELDIDKTIKKIIKLDQNDQLYMKMMQQPWVLPKENIHPSENVLLDFFENIFTQGPKNSYRIPRKDMTYNESLNWLSECHKREKEPLLIRKVKKLKKYFNLSD